VSDGRPTISTHVLDTQAGRPAKGVPVRLSRLVDDGGEVAAGEGTTDADGRVRSLLLDDLTPGDYRLRFDLRSLEGGFFEGMAIDLHIDDASRSYHVPLLIAPYAVTTYRGS